MIKSDKHVAVKPFQLKYKGRNSEIRVYNGEGRLLHIESPTGKRRKHQKKGDKHD